MSRGVVERKYEEFLDRMGEKMVEAAKEEVGGDGLVGSIMGEAAGMGARAKVMSIKEQMQKQGTIVIEYAEARSRGEDDLEVYERPFLRSNPVLERYEGPREEELRDQLVTHFHQVGEDLAPLMDADIDPATDDFYDALRAEYTREEAKQVIENNFEQAKTFKEYESGLSFDSPGISRDQVIDIIETGEDRLKQEIYREIDRAYGGS
ncbi:MAG: hypothetical protein SVU32_09255 [Candidatus Nanohaloarchaea archaeon]|nr:hypothetical protein [Candidatus Nanohaloarchaea archaeon]